MKISKFVRKKNDLEVHILPDGPTLPVTDDILTLVSMLKPTEEQARKILEEKLTLEYLHSTTWLMWDVTQRSRREDAVNTILKYLKEFGFLRDK